VARRPRKASVARAARRARPVDIGIFVLVEVDKRSMTTCGFLLSPHCPARRAGARGLVLADGEVPSHAST